MSTLQLGRPVRPGLVTRHGSEIGLEATLGLIKIINMPIYLLLLELAKNSHVSHHETVRRNQTLWSENFLHFFTDVHDDEFDGQWMSTQ